MPIQRVLIANRGEIALRVIRSCRTLGLQTVLAVSEADRDSLPARHADRAVCIGPSRPGDSYLKIDTLVQAALGTGCRCRASRVRLSFRAPGLRATLRRGGPHLHRPTPEQVEAVGDKLRARAAAEAAQVPVVPGGAVQSLHEAVALAARIGAPLLIKAVGGGGGRGMKRVDHLDELPMAMDMASAEAGAAFGDARVYLERYVARARHVEVQVLGDGRGNVIHLGERDCSVQRRYQKVIEESPAPVLDATLRAALHESAVRFAARLHYRGAGTVEFLVDVERGEFYFLEMNARIQVEHPVTEQITGLDLVAAQIRVADGGGLALTQPEVRFSGHAIECRINAEDPARDFMPSPGRVTRAEWPQGEGIRVDTHIVAGSMVPPFYDSLMGKIIAHGTTREIARTRLIAALEATRIDGVHTNLAFQAGLLADPGFIRGGIDTGFLGRRGN